MISYQLLVSTKKPDETRLGRFTLSEVALRITVSKWPGEAELWATFFVTSHEALPDMEICIVATKIGESLKIISSRPLKLQGGGETIFGIVHWPRLPIVSEGAYRIALHTKDPATGKWAEPPASFWIVHVVQSDSITKQ